MQFIWQHSKNILVAYKGDEPLHIFLKGYFKQHPKLGSRDRKMLSEMTYSWYRCSRAVKSTLPFEEQMTVCLHLCQTNNRHLLRISEPYYPPSQVKQVNIEIEDIFSNNVTFSEGIDRTDWLNSMLVQPDLFIRVRKEKEQVLDILSDAEVAYEELSEDCVALPNGTPVDRMLPPFVYVVQDASSQKTTQYFEPKPYQHWWDACSGAGGKSLALKDKEPLIDLTATDTRKSILTNLTERFRLYSHIFPTTHKVDVTNKEELSKVMDKHQFDNIICDVPCTGSGTWARTPEQLYYFDADTIKDFAIRQGRIAINTAKYLKPDGKLFYITCSVFKEENEGVVNHILENTTLKLKEQHLINGTENRADSMFIAVLEQS